MASWSVISLSIQSGSTVTSAARIVDADHVALHMGGISSASLAIDYCVLDPTSAGNFQPVWAVGSGGAFALPIATGSMGLVLTPYVVGFPVIRIRTSAAQAIAAPGAQFILSVRRN